MRKTTGAACAVLAATTALGVSACGQVEPKVAFAKAYQGTTAQKDATSTMSIKTTSADIDKLVTALGGDTVTEPSAKVAVDALKKSLPKMTWTTKAHSNGATLDSETDPKKIDQSVSIAIDGAGMDVVTVGGQPFFKVDVDGIGAKTGLFTGAQAKMLMGSVPPQMSWVGDVIDGKWIGLPAATLDKLLASKDAGIANDPAKMKELREKMQASIEKNATFEKADDSHINVAIKLKPFLKDFQQIAASAAPSSSASASPTALTDKDLENIKDDAVLKVATTVENDRITESSVDIPQMWGWIDETKLKGTDKEQLDKVKASGFTGSFVAKTSTDPVTITKPADARILTDDEIAQIEKMTKQPSTSTDMSTSTGMATPAA